MPHSENDKHSSTRRRDDRPKIGPSEDLDARINGLESAKLEPSMTKADIAALDRVIEKLKVKKAEKNPKPQAQSESAV